MNALAEEFDPASIITHDPVVRVEGISKHYGSVEALRSIDLLRLVESENKTFIFVTHSIEEAAYVSDRIVLLSPRPGRVSQVIEPKIDRSADPDDIRHEPDYLDVVEVIWQGLHHYAG